MNHRFNIYRFGFSPSSIAPFLGECLSVDISQLDGAFLLYDWRGFYLTVFSTRKQIKPIKFKETSRDSAGNRRPCEPVTRIPKGEELDERNISLLGGALLFLLG
jgi:hypothetical protein